MQRKPQLVLAVVVCILVGFGVYQLLFQHGPGPAPMQEPGVATITGQTPREAEAVVTPAATEAAPSRTEVATPAAVAGESDPAFRAALCGFTGRLVDPELEPVPGAEVKLLRIAIDTVFAPGVGPFASDRVDAPDPVAGRATSGADGRFLIPGVFPHGDFILHADSEGDSPTWRIVERAVGPGEIADLGDIVLERAGILIGTVVDEDDKPLADALVRAIDLPGTVLSFVPFERFDPKGGILAEVPDKRAMTMPSWVEQRMEDLPIPHTRTDAEGRFRLLGVSPGGNLVAVNYPGRVPHVKQRIVVRAGEEKDLGTVKMNEGETAVGKVEDEAGKPVAGAEVMVAARSAAAPIHFASFTRSTDAEGKFEATGLPGGEVMAAARRGPGDPWFFSDMQPVARDLVIKMPANATLTVTVVDQEKAAVTDPRLQLTAGDDESVIAMTMFGVATPIPLTGRTRRGEHGEVILTDLPRGRYMLLVDSPLHATTMESVNLETDTTVEVTLKVKVTFTVTIRRPDGGPAVGSDLFMHPRAEGAPDVPLHAGRADAEGKVEVDAPPGATARLTARHPAYGLTSMEVKLPIAAPVEMVFAAPGTVEGVLTENGSPPAPGKYMIYASQRGGGGAAVPQIPLITAPDLEGKFRFPALAPGEYYLGVAKALGGLRSPGGAMGMVRDSWLDNDMPSERVTVVAAQTAKVVFDTARTRTIDGPTVRLSGVVTVDGRLARDHVVTSWGNGSRQRVAVDSTGRFEFKQVPVGHLSLTVTQPPPEDLFSGRGRPLDIWQSQFEAKEGNDVDLTIDVVTATIEGNVRSIAGEPIAGANVQASGQLGTADHPTGNLWRNSTTDADGHFKLDSMPGGTWSLSADKSGQGRSDQKQVALAPGIAASGIELTLRPTVHLRGRVDFAVLGSERPKQAYMWLQARPRDSGRGGGFAEIESDGGFEMSDVADGSYQVQINCRNEKDEWTQLYGPDELVVAGRDVDNLILRPVRERPEDGRGKR